MSKLLRALGLCLVVICCLIASYLLKRPCHSLLLDRLDLFPHKKYEAAIVLEECFLRYSNQNNSASCSVQAKTIIISNFHSDIEGHDIKCELSKKGEESSKTIIKSTTAFYNPPTSSLTTSPCTTITHNEWNCTGGPFTVTFPDLFITTTTNICFQHANLQLQAHQARVDVRSQTCQLEGNIETCLTL